MATLARSLVSATKQSVFAAAAYRSYSVASCAGIPNPGSLICRIRPLIAAASGLYSRRLAPVPNRAFSTRQASSSLNDPNPNWSNRPPKETILLDGCDFEHWLVVMEKPEGDPTRDEIIDSYIKTLAMVVGSEEEARMKIYSVSTKHYFAFGALVSEELSYKLKELQGVRWVLPDSYLDVKNKDYGGEPFINGQAVPYDPKYHEEWVRNNARANERNRRNDRPRNFDRSRNFDRRREPPQTGGFNPGPNPGPSGNFAGQPNVLPPQQNYSGGMPPQNNPGNYPPPQNNHPGNYPPPQNNPGNYMPPQNNPGNYPPPSNAGGPPNNGPGYPYNQGPNAGAPFQPAPGPNQQGYSPNAGPPPPGYAPPNAAGNSFQNQPPPNNFNFHQGSAPVQAPGNFGPNGGYPGGQGGYAPNPGQQNYGPNVGYPGNQNVPGRD